MEFIDYSSFPIVASADCSPTTEAFSYPGPFDKPYIPAPNTSAIPSEDSFALLDAYFDRPVSSVEAPKNLQATSSITSTTATQYTPSYKQPFNQAPFAQLEPLSSGFTFDAPAGPFDFNLSPLSSPSSLDGDAAQDAALLTPPPLSPRPQLKRESSASPFKIEDVPAPKPKRKRGRPRLDRSNSTLSSASSKAQRAQRLPHNQVERKYREGLNASLERLRRSVPTLCQDDEVDFLSQSRPSKATILAGAIEYIKAIEKERDAFRDEARRLRSSCGGGVAWRSREGAELAGAGF